MLKNLLRDQRGNMLVLSAVGLTFVIGFAAWTIDVGYILTANTQLQNAVDAAALAGASGLIYNSNEATDRAIAFAGRNDCINAPVNITANNISFPRRHGSRFK
jgi:Flp pilus assembly protein TadG